MLNIKTLCSAIVLTLLTTHAVAENNYWNPSKSRVEKSEISRSGYTSALHQKMSNKAEYEEGGAFFYSNYTNSFGQKEVLDSSQEMIFCQGSERTFTETVKTLFKGGGQGFAGEKSAFMARDDSTSVGFSPDAFEEAVGQTLQLNGTTNAKGRFCYRENDSKVDYRDAGAAQAVYCDPTRSASHAAAKTFTDTSSGNSCEIKLDIPLKLGETRFIRQLQTTPSATIAQGFVGCYANSTSGIPEVALIDNPSSCTKTNRETCVKTCEWAYQVVCDAKLMPKWGGGKCGGIGTMLFKEDAVEVNSVDALSYNTDEKKLYRGSAIMSCAMVSGKAQWIVNSSSCLPVSNPVK